MAKKKESTEVSTEQAEAKVFADQQRRREAAIAGLQALCERHKVDPVFLTQIVNGQISQAIDFQPR